MKGIVKPSVFYSKLLKIHSSTLVAFILWCLYYLFGSGKFWWPGLSKKGQKPLRFN